MNARFSKKVVAGIVFLNAAFAVAVLVIFAKTGTEPSVLIGAWFAFTTGELWACALIKRAKVDAGTQEDPAEEVEDENEEPTDLI